MPKKRTSSKLTFLDTIPNEARIKLINKNSYKFIDHLGKERIQSIKDFQKENQPYLKIKPHDQKIRKKTADFIRHIRTSSFVIPRPKRVLWEQFQTDIRHQKDRGTCSGFAIVAAIEARYKRDFNLDLDLSEQYYWHCFKSSVLTFPRRHRYENPSSFWGGGNSQEVRRSTNFSLPLERDCPYKSHSEMKALRDENPAAGLLVWKNEPEENTVTQNQVDAFEYAPNYISDKARQNARYGTKSFVLFEPRLMRDPLYLELFLSLGYEIIVDAHLQWKTNAEGIREFKANENAGHHGFLIVGYDRDEGVFYIKNSWGEAGFIRVTYEFAKKCFSHGSIVTAVTDPTKPNRKARAIGRWNMNHDGWKGELIIRRPTNKDNDITRLGHYIGSDGSIMSINGKYIDDGRGIEFARNEDPDANPSSRAGQKFIVHLYGKEIQYAAGDTKWNQIPFGTYLSREEIRSSSGSFTRSKWKGKWSMNHDGWKGILTITGIISLPLNKIMVTGTYLHSDGSLKHVSGKLDPRHPHIMNFTINFSSGDNRPFVLHFHTRSADLASGYTFWNGHRFGVVAFKNP